MNAVTQTEAIAIETAAPLEVADPSKNLILVPLPQLLPRRSKRNVRTTPRLSIPELAASICRVGLLQNLVVILAADGGQYEVVAGDRRLTALKLLAKKKRIAAGYEVPCLLVADASARTISLAENVQREAMHPADQFAAFAALVKEGRPVEDIAADFGVSPLVVQRRLKLANVSPRLLADYRAADVTLDQLMALAITDDHAAQEAAFYDSPQWQRSPQALREHLTEREVDGARDALARFVGIEAYEAAGGGVRRDLFADDTRGVFLMDAPLLETLAQAKLVAAADSVRAEGWAWVEAVPRITSAELHGFERARRDRRAPNKTEAKRIAKLEARQRAIEDALTAGEVEDMADADAQALEEESDQLSAELDTIEQSLLTFAPETLTRAGVIVTVDHAGTIAIHRGLLHEAEAKALKTLERQAAKANGNDESETQEPATLHISEKLARRLSAHRTAGLQAEVARHPQVALVAVVHGLALRVIFDGHRLSHSPINISAAPQDGLEKDAPDIAQSPALAGLRQVRHAWAERLPDDPDALFAELLAMPQPELLSLLAVCVATTVGAVTSRDNEQPAATLARAVNLDMHPWWTPTADGYFTHVSKAKAIEAVQVFAPEHAARLSKLKKNDLASEAERLAVGSGWLPMMLRGSALDVQTDEPSGADTTE